MYKIIFKTFSVSLSEKEGFMSSHREAPKLDVQLATGCK